MESNEVRVRKVIEDWAAAVGGHDRPGILARHAENVLMFDFPSTLRGIRAYDETWNFFFAEPEGPITFVPGELEVTAGDNVAFSTCTIRCDGTSSGPLEFRLTTGLEQIDGDWIITHEHHSLPTIEERFIAPQGGRG